MSFGHILKMMPKLNDPKWNSTGKLFLRQKGKKRRKVTMGSIIWSMYRILSYKHHISMLGDRHTDKGLL